MTEWTDVAFTALPLGWMNYYRRPDGTYWSVACPGMLLQERHINGERETRVTPATSDEGFVVPADDKLAASGDAYCTTTTVEQWAQWRAERDDAQRAGVAAG